MTKTPQVAPPGAPRLLVRIFESLALHQALFAASELGVADLLAEGPRSAADLAGCLNAHEPSLYRVLRLLASKGIFAELSPRTFSNTDVSNALRTSATGSLRSMARFRGSDYFYRPFREILYSLQTGLPARSKVLGMDGWEFLRQHPGVAALFDDAMTDSASLVAPAIAASYDFSQWDSVMDVGGGNGVLLAAILRAYPKLRGVLADRSHVLERARQRGLLGGELETRSTMQNCDFFNEIPSGSRAYLMKSVIHDWNDEDARRILHHCRKAMPENGAVLLIEWDLSEANLPSQGKVADVTMMVLTGGKERTIEEYRELLESASFRLNQVISTDAGFNVLEALPI
jgi:O-methyltransferase/methyltransferase family protein